MEIVTEMLRKCVKENANNPLNQEEYEEYEEISEKCESIWVFIKELEQRESLITEVDEELWKCSIEKVVVNADKKITFIFKDDMELWWNI